MKKIATLTFAILLFPLTAFAGDWTQKDIYREIAWETLLLADYSQTLTISRNTERFHEYNPILGSHPRESSVNLYFASCAIIHPIVAHFLPPKSDAHRWINRENWQNITIAIEVGAIGTNILAGIGFSF
jgi:hypothetical protein